MKHVSFYLIYTKQSMEHRMNTYYILTIVVGCAIYLATLVKSQQGPGVDCLCFEPFAKDEILYQPTAFEIAPNDTLDRLFVGEQRGIIWIFFSDGSRLQTPFLNMSSTPLFLSYLTGLFQFAFHPDFANNGLLYLHYSARYGGQYYQRVSEMSVSITDPNVVDPSTERVVLDVPYKNESETHQGGGFLFGDDGYLYIGTGDAKCCGDPLKNGQNKSTIHATVLRIDVDSRSAGEYGIPPDNPFLDEPETVPEIYAYGIRQAFTAAIDTGDRFTGRGKGRIFVGDVGDKDFEEVILIESAGNYGWSTWEGNMCHNPNNCNVTDKYVAPIVTYNRTYGSCVILGGVYRGCMNPDLNGWLIFGDYTTGKYFGAQEVNTSLWNAVEIPLCENTECPAGSLRANETIPYLMAMGHDVFGEYYVSTVLGTDPPDIAVAAIYKLVDPKNPGTMCRLDF